MDIPSIETAALNQSSQAGSQSGQKQRREFHGMRLGRLPNSNALRSDTPEAKRMKVQDGSSQMAHALTEKLEEDMPMPRQQAEVDALREQVRYLQAELQCAAIRHEQDEKHLDGLEAYICKGLEIRDQKEASTIEQLNMRLKEEQGRAEKAELRAEKAELGEEKAELKAENRARKAEALMGRMIREMAEFRIELRG